MLNAFNVISSIYDKYKPNDRKSFLNYSFVLKKLLIMLGKVEYAKYIPQLKTHYDIMKTIMDEIHNETNVLYNYTIPIRFQYLNVY